MTPIERRHLGDAWRGTLAEVDEHIFWIRRHSQYDDAYSRKMLQYRLKRYPQAVRRLSGYEERMGGGFVREPVYAARDFLATQKDKTDAR